MISREGDSISWEAAVEVAAASIASSVNYVHISFQETAALASVAAQDIRV